MKRLAILLLMASLALPLFAADSASVPRAGEELYRTYCTNCHGSGWQAAPIAYDEKEWSPRVIKGFDALFANTKKGLNSMPPMGTCMDCSDAELQAAIKEMLRF